MKISWKRILYIICFATLCLMDQRKGSGSANIQFFFSNFGGIMIALILFSAYSLKSFIRIPYTEHV